ncbi:hypothetical protein ACN2XU_06615 [Primorskyibacter sp. 2E107]|uniref:hypothetical protein n=1 Tax=Primorskyibacter sp. 2E107 TaxID=3403458 RepID=UPI003AF468F7
MSKLDDFLNKNNIIPSEELPAVHTTQAFNLQEIIDTAELTPRPCNVFKGEDLLYYFYGKPSYKPYTSLAQSRPFEMPVCFMVPLSALSPIKRIYPFDSGAFVGNRHPDYISKMKIGNFEATPSLNNPRKIVGALFTSVEKFFSLDGKNENDFKNEFHLGILDAEMTALNILANDKSLSTIDDRRFAVEIQIDHAQPLNSKTVDAVVLPEQYLEDTTVVSFVTETLQAVPITYTVFSASSSDHTPLIYSKILEYYKDQGTI